MKKTSIVGIFILCLSTVQAKVMLAPPEIESQKKTTKFKDKKDRLHQIEAKRIEQYQIEGYADSKYVRFVVDIANKKFINGYQIEKDGAETYVNGELVDGVLHIYDSNSNHLTVILAR